VFFSDDLAHPSSILQFTAAAERRGIKPYRLTPNKNGNVFTKVKIDYDADVALMNYFKKNKEKIESWFNIIAPKGKTITNLKDELIVLSKKDWWKVYK
jgi:hypothetical protein